LRRNSLFLFLSLLVLSTQTTALVMCPEWFPASGTLVVYPFGVPDQLLIDLAEDDTLYVLAGDQQQQDAADYLNSIGADPDNCLFLDIASYSHWTRDWGPQICLNDFWEAEIIDPMFSGYPWVSGGDFRNQDRDRDWSEDDQVNEQLAEALQIANHPFPAYLTGGNIMYDGKGIAFSTRQMLDENSALDNDTFLELASAHLGLFRYYITPNTENYGIQHIDCSAKFLDEETILVKRIPEYHPEYERIENFVDYLSETVNCYGSPYRIVRIDCGIYDDQYLDSAAYTNSFILNKKVFVPLFGIDTDDSALETYRSAMPGYEINGYYYNEWYYYDALHCRTMAIFDPDMIFMSHEPLFETDYQPIYTLEVKIRSLSNSGLITDSLKCYWKTSAEASFNCSELTATDMEDIFSAEISGLPPDTQVEYYFSSADNSGRVRNLPLTAPDKRYSFYINTVAANELHLCIPQVEAAIAPNPYYIKNKKSTLRLIVNNSYDEAFAFKVFNLKGQLIITENIRTGKGSSDIQITLPDHLPAGMYFYSISNEKQRLSDKFLIIK